MEELKAGFYSLMFLFFFSIIGAIAGIYLMGFISPESNFSIGYFGGGLIGFIVGTIVSAIRNNK